jgi:hypothetical protein
MRLVTITGSPAFENLKQASAQAADELKTSCPAQTPATPWRGSKLQAIGCKLWYKPSRPCVRH